MDSDSLKSGLNDVKSGVEDMSPEGKAIAAGAGLLIGGKVLHSLYKRHKIKKLRRKAEETNLQRRITQDTMLHHAYGLADRGISHIGKGRVDRYMKANLAAHDQSLKDKKVTKKQESVEPGFLDLILEGQDPNAVINALLEGMDELEEQEMSRRQMRKATKKNREQMEYEQSVSQLNKVKRKKALANAMHSGLDGAEKAGQYITNSMSQAGDAVSSLVGDLKKKYYSEAVDPFIKSTRKEQREAALGGTLLGSALGGIYGLGAEAKRHIKGQGRQGYLKSATKNAVIGGATLGTIGYAGELVRTTKLNRWADKTREVYPDLDSFVSSLSRKDESVIDEGIGKAAVLGTVGAADGAILGGLIGLGVGAVKRADAEPGQKKKWSHYIGKGMKYGALIKGGAGALAGAGMRESVEDILSEARSKMKKEKESEKKESKKHERMEKQEKAHEKSETPAEEKKEHSRKGCEKPDEMDESIFQKEKSAKEKVIDHARHAAIVGGVGALTGAGTIGIHAIPTAAFGAVAGGAHALMGGGDPTQSLGKRMKKQMRTGARIGGAVGAASGAAASVLTVPAAMMGANEIYHDTYEDKSPETAAILEAMRQKKSVQEGVSSAIVGATGLGVQGALTGALGGLLYGAIKNDNAKPWEKKKSLGHYVKKGAKIVGLAGAGLGGLGGLSIPEDSEASEEDLIDEAARKKQKKNAVNPEAVGIAMGHEANKAHVENPVTADPNSMPKFQHIVAAKNQVPGTANSSDRSKPYGS